MNVMKSLRWDSDKNRWLREQRGLMFEDVAIAIEAGGLLDDLEHPDASRYPGQRVLVVRIGEAVCAVPYVEDEDGWFLKTIYPSRKLARRYREREGEGRP